MSYINCPPCVRHNPSLIEGGPPKRSTVTRMIFLEEVSAMQMKEQSGRRPERIRMIAKTVELFGIPS